MNFVNPKTDFAFKKIFGQESSKDILISFLNAILDYTGDNEILDLDFLDPASLPKIEALKTSFLDVSIRTKAGKQIIIEMQVQNVEALEQRVLYNVTKRYSNQLSKSEHYSLLKPVIGLTIADFNIIKDNNNYLSYFTLQEKHTGIKYNNEDIELVFVELPKFHKKLEELETIQDKWIYFLRYAQDLELIPDRLKSVKEVERAFHIAERSKMTAEELEAIEKREIFLMDIEGRYMLGKREGKEEIYDRLIKLGVSEEIAKQATYGEAA